MKITCPNCATIYQMPDDYIKQEGQSVKCANCDETWQAKQTIPQTKPQARDPETGPDSSQHDVDTLFGEAVGQAGKKQSQDDIEVLYGNDNDHDGEAVMQSVPEEAPAAPIMVTAKGDNNALPPFIDAMDAESFEARKALARGRDIESSVRRRRRHSDKNRSRQQASSESSTHKTEWIIGGAAMAASLLLIGLFLLMPRAIVKAIPDFASLYDMVGVNVNLSGVGFDAVDVTLQQHSGSPTVSVQAELVNLGSKPVILPSVQLSILGKDASELYSWAISSNGIGLGPGERKLIDTSVAAPSQAKELVLRIFHDD